MEYISGEILTENGFKKGYIGLDKGKIIEFGREKPKEKPIANGFIIPTLINSHTHIGDYFIKELNIKLPNNIEKLVAPPKGIKHKLLKETSEKEIINGMKESINIMSKSGISKFYDFRENGISGIQQLKEAIYDHEDISSLILSRPNHLRYHKEEIKTLLENSQGIGLSSITDWDYSEILKIAKYTKIKNKIFAIHASERIRENIDLILDLKPDFLIHMNYATESDLIRVKENNISIAICPRSNKFFKLKTNFTNMEKLDINLMLGTDNAMLNSPNIFTELAYFKKISKTHSIEKLLNMITYNPRKALNLDYNILDLKLPKEFIVLDNKTLKIIYAPSTHEEVKDDN
jgi:cytosine/adenosine deaminase-related metal-dependent hydrolase